MNPFFTASFRKKAMIGMGATLICACERPPAPGTSEVEKRRLSNVHVANSDPLGNREGTAPALLSGMGKRETPDFYALPRKDFNECVATIRKTIAPEKQEEMLQGLATEVCLMDLDQYEAIAAYIKQAERKQKLNEAIVRAWLKRDPWRLLGFAEKSLVGPFKNKVMSDIVRLYLARGDRESAAKVFGRMPFSSERSSTLEDVTRAWKPDQIDEAIQWASALQLRGDRTTALTALVNDATDLGQLDTLERLALAANEPNLNKSIAAQIGKLKGRKEDSEGVSAWVDSLPQRQRTPAILGVIDGMAGTKPEFATRLALTLPTARDKQYALALILDPTLRDDPETAAHWVLNLPAGAEQREMVRRLTQGWYDIDSIALSDWINRIERGPLRDEALVTLAKQLLNSDRKAALQVAQAIQDEKRRNAFFKAHNKP